MFKTLGQSFVVFMVATSALTLSPAAKASFVRAYTSSGSGSTTMSLSGDVSLSAKENADEDEVEGPLTSWLLNWSASQTKSTAVTPNETTKSYELGVTYSKEKYLDLVVGGELSKSELGEVEGSGPYVTVSKTWKYKQFRFLLAKQKAGKQKSRMVAQAAEKEKEQFSPSISISYTYKQIDYFQKAPRSNGQNFTAQQISSGGSIDWEPLPWLGLIATTTGYSYNKNMVGLYNLFNGAVFRAVRGANLTDGLSSTVQGLYNYDYGYTVNFKFTEDTGIDLSYNRSVPVVNPEWDTTLGVAFYSTIGESWSYNIGISQSKTDGTSSSTTAGDLTLSYFF